MHVCAHACTDVYAHAYTHADALRHRQVLPGTRRHMPTHMSMPISAHMSICACLYMCPYTCLYSSAPLILDAVHFPVASAAHRTLLRHLHAPTHACTNTCMRALMHTHTLARRAHWCTRGSAGHRYCWVRNAFLTQPYPVFCLYT